MNDRETLIARVMETGGQLRVRSALNPILWLCGIVTGPTVLSISFGSSTSPWLILLAIAPVMVVLLGFVFLLIFDRDKLQSEEYQLKKQSLEMIQEKGDPFPTNAMTAVLTENPELPAIEPPKGGSKRERLIFSYIAITWGRETRLENGSIRFRMYCIGDSTCQIVFT